MTFDSANGSLPDYFLNFHQPVFPGAYNYRIIFLIFISGRRGTRLDG